jgi:phosphoglycolate phosphatase
MRYRLIIFDFDGTLADSIAWVAGVFNDVARAHGFRTIGADEMAMLRGKGNREIVRYLGVPAWRMPFIAMHMRKLAAEAAPRLKLFDGIGDLLHALKGQGLTLAIVSSNGEDTIRKVLGPELADLISYYGGGASVFGKAAKFKAVMRKARVAASETLCIGDEQRDIEAAHAIGAAAGAVTWGYATREALTEADHLFERPHEVMTAS